MQRKHVLPTGNLLYKYMTYKKHSHSNFHRACLKNKTLPTLCVMAHTQETEVEKCRFLRVQRQPAQFVHTEYETILHILFSFWSKLYKLFNYLKSINYILI